MEKLLFSEYSAAELTEYSPENSAHSGKATNFLSPRASRPFRSSKKACAASRREIFLDQTFIKLKLHLSLDFIIAPGAKEYLERYCRINRYDLSLFKNS
jgi:hypothetical protein